KDNQRFNNPSGRSVNETLATDRSDTKVEELPSQLTREIFVELANFQKPNCISLYMATNADASVEANRQKDFITFKNKLQELTAELRNKGEDQAVIDVLLKPGYDLLRTESFWGGLNKGLGVFMAEGYFKY